MLEISFFLRRLRDLRSKFLIFFSLNSSVLLWSIKLIFTKVFPFVFNSFEISYISSSDLTLKITSLIGLLKRSFNDAIFWTFKRLNLFSSLDVLLINVNIRELPSINISRFNSKISENINNSKTLVKSVNYKTA